MQCATHLVALLGRQAQDGFTDDLQREQAELLLHINCTGQGEVGVMTRHAFSCTNRQDESERTNNES